MRGSHIVIGAVCAIAAVGAAPACRAPTEIKIEISTDVKCSDVKGTAITIGDLPSLDGKPTTTVTPACDPSTGRIGSMVIVPSGAKDDLVAIKIVMGIGKDPTECVPVTGPGCIVARRALHFIESSSLLVPIFLGAVCRGVPCDATQTCAGGNCTNATIDDSSKCEAPGGCNEGALAPPLVVDAGLPDVAVPATGPCANGTACDVVTSQTVLDVAVTPTALFWLDSTGLVMTSALDGSGARVVVMGQPAPLAGIEAHAEYVYFGAAGQLKRTRISDGIADLAVGGVGGGCVKWITPGVTMWAAAPASGAIFLVDFGVGAFTQVISGAIVPTGVAGTGGVNALYYTSSVAAGAVRLADGQPFISKVLVQDQNLPRCMATDGASLWWANMGSGALVKSTTAGTNIQEIATGQTNISGVALDSTWVYWSWQGGIRKRAK